MSGGNSLEMLMIYIKLFSKEKTVNLEIFMEEILKLEKNRSISVRKPILIN